MTALEKVSNSIFEHLLNGERVIIPGFCSVKLRKCKKTQLTSLRQDKLLQKRTKVDSIKHLSKTTNGTILSFSIKDNKFDSTHRIKVILPYRTKLANLIQLNPSVVTSL